MDLSDFRREFIKDGLSRADLEKNPILLFSKWFEQAQKTDIVDCTAMILATVNSTGRPSQRTVLLKYFDDNGFVFFTNYSSRKATDLKGNQQVSLIFAWLELERQVIVSGTAGKVSVAESAKYFMSRPKESQMAAWISSQSQPVSSRQVLVQKFQEMKTKIGEKKVPLPSFWGGYRVKPAAIEFWQGRKNRLHDRFLYTKDDESGLWSRERLAP